MFLTRTANPSAARGAADPPDGLARALRPVCDALAAGAPADEVLRQFRARADRRWAVNAPAFAGDLLRALGESAADGLVAAFAATACLHCHGGFERCDGCDGHGRAGRDGHGPERHACGACLTLGVVPCPFCGGSGLDGCDAVPAGLLAAVVGRRVAEAADRLAAADAHDPLPAKVSPGQVPVLRRAQARAVVATSRDLAVARNAAVAARAIRRSQLAGRPRTAALFVQAAGTARAARERLARCYRVLAAASEHLARRAGSDAAYERARADLFAGAAAEMARAAGRRATLFPGR
jgi:hypothetical protein